MTPHILEFYASPAAVTAAGPHASALGELPRDTRQLAVIVQGVIVHQYLAGAYGIRVPDERKAELQVRPAAAILAGIFALDPRPLFMGRPAIHRFAGICRHFEVLYLAMLRAHGIPARARRGFGSYFSPNFEDHELTEVWNVAESRWQRIDPQLDAVQRKVLGVDFDPFDVPRDRFLDAADAWTQCRSGALDAGRFGIEEMRGLWFIAANLVRDVAWLNKVEMLPWDVWGAMPPVGAALDPAQLAFFDRLAELTRDPDASFAELRSRYEAEPALHVPAIVHNAMTQRDDASGV
jgi:transglutaminase superfamily protein